MTTIQNRLIKMTAVGDTYKPRAIMHQVRFVGKGLTIGDLLQVVDNNNDIYTEHYVVNTVEDIPVLGTGVKLFSNGLKIASMPGGGQCEVQFHLL